MLRWTWMALALGLATGAWAREPEPGRTDGSEGSEYGKGGYMRYRSEGRFYVSGSLGAATVDIEPEGSGISHSQTDMVAGISGGYQVDDWLAMEMGYARIADQKTSIYSMGMRSDYNMDPFGYYFTLGAEIYSPERGDDQFGVVPGIGAQVLLGDHVRVGLGYQHDFILSDDSIGINRVTARLQLTF